MNGILSNSPRALTEIMRHGNRIQPGRGGLQDRDGAADVRGNGGVLFQYSQADALRYRPYSNGEANSAIRIRHRISGHGGASAGAAGSISA